MQGILMPPIATELLKLQVNAHFKNTLIYFFVTFAQFF